MHYAYESLAPHLRSTKAKKMFIAHIDLSQVHSRAFSDISRFLFISKTDKEKKLDTDVEGCMY